MQRKADKVDKNHAYEMGIDYAKNGANEKNCHFSIFATKENTSSWEQGRESIDNQ